MSDKKDTNLECSFCGKKRNEVKKLIAGPTSYICNECINISHKIINDVEVEELNLEHIPEPQEIKDFLDDYVIGQDYAKEVLSVSAYNHYKRILFDTKNEIEKSNCVVVGPTGSGKTLLAQTLAKKLKVPFAIADATTLTEAGYVGEDVESVIERLLNTCDWNIELAERGIVFIDEIDKKTRSSESNTSTKDISGEGVQQALLRLIEGTTIKVSTNGSKRMDEFIEFNTQNVLFVVSGSFVGLEQVVKKRLNKTSIGFNKAVGEKFQSDSWLEYVEHRDLIEFGLIPEFVGRLPNLIHLRGLTEEQMVEVLQNAKGSVLKQMQKLLEFDDIQIDFSKQYLKDVANLAIDRKVGARGLKSIIESSLHNIMFRAPTLKLNGVDKISFNKYPKDLDSYPVLSYNTGISEVDTNYKLKKMR
jgi:ATP-dependent Clp protease ATP-binding subunit ClpX